jgi:hypothetical protein
MSFDPHSRGRTKQCSHGNETDEDYSTTNVVSSTESHRTSSYSNTSNTSNNTNNNNTNKHEVPCLAVNSTESAAVIKPHWRKRKLTFETTEGRSRVSASSSVPVPPSWPTATFQALQPLSLTIAQPIHEGFNNREYQYAHESVHGGRDQNNDDDGIEVNDEEDNGPSDNDSNNGEGQSPGTKVAVHDVDDYDDEEDDKKDDDDDDDSDSEKDDEEKEKKRRMKKWKRRIHGEPLQVDVLCGRGGMFLYVPTENPLYFFPLLLTFSFFSLPFVLRQGTSNHHPGNEWYRRLIRSNRALYRACPKHTKLLVSKAIVQAVQQQGGRFLDRYINKKKPEFWYPVSYKRAVDKTSQGLRERERPRSEKKAKAMGGKGANGGGGQGDENGSIASTAGDSILSRGLQTASTAALLAIAASAASTSGPRNTSIELQHPTSSPASSFASSQHRALQPTSPLTAAVSREWEAIIQAGGKDGPNLNDLAQVAVSQAGPYKPYSTNTNVGRQTSDSLIEADESSKKRRLLTTMATANDDGAEQNHLLPFASTFALRPSSSSVPPLESHLPSTSRHTANAGNGGIGVDGNAIGFPPGFGANNSIALSAFNNQNRDLLRQSSIPSLLQAGSSTQAFYTLPSSSSVSIIPQHSYRFGNVPPPPPGLSSFQSLVGNNRLGMGGSSMGTLPPHLTSSTSIFGTIGNTNMPPPPLTRLQSQVSDWLNGTFIEMPLQSPTMLALRKLRQQQQHQHDQSNLQPQSDVQGYVTDRTETLNDAGDRASNMPESMNRARGLPEALATRASKEPYPPPPPLSRQSLSLASCLSGRLQESVSSLSVATNAPQQQSRLIYNLQDISSDNDIAVASGPSPLPNSRSGSFLPVPGAVKPAFRNPTISMFPTPSRNAAASTTTTASSTPGQFSDAEDDDDDPYSCRTYLGTQTGNETSSTGSADSLAKLTNPGSMPPVASNAMPPPSSQLEHSVSATLLNLAGATSRFFSTVFGMNIDDHWNSMMLDRGSKPNPFSASDATIASATHTGMEDLYQDASVASSNLGSKSQAQKRSLLDDFDESPMEARLRSF